jgi:hypothetical protein
MGQALIDHLDRRMREDAVRVHHGELIARQELQLQVPHQGQVRKSGLQAELLDGGLGREQDVRRDVDAVVVPGIEIVDEQPSGAQVAAADLQHPVAWLQPVLEQVVELHLADLEPRLVGLAADRALLAAGRVRFHHGTVVTDVVTGLHADQGVAAAPPGIGQDPAGMP